ncbi:hypothetical protein FNO01nite_16050 [Flavobacterium noncentrifugens]|uniref:Haloacid dehalogenase-like hydrolase n=1 Tax=Flavobacterium noncentrifugens TaxID=1128970 RepID=A0A1G8WHM5_9FLAO|nr:hypothetical protein [Flavobacterium noncentrifugens]GEP50933.1 hypothetical protein FNO01nite_16050 [Flavobacterium noncentrifugens]SDJ77711.1 hypothetical protein SAMN04487935_1822 [Flavobacterium noncentrifugens]
MNTNLTKISDVVLDFDGTCTQIQVIYQAYLNDYFQNLIDFLQVNYADVSITSDEWQAAQQQIREHSPSAGWMLAGCPSAPAAADPYILADESAKFLLRKKEIYVSIPADINARAYAANPAPWRDDVYETINRLIENGIDIHFVSNSGTKMINGRLQELFEGVAGVPKKINVQSDAAKFKICELAWDNETVAKDNRILFNCLAPVAWGNHESVTRPIYIRRGAYFEAICKVFNNNLQKLKSTVFCGDIWEMDLAMPHALGANVHLLDRAHPFETYNFELKAVSNYGNFGKSGKNFSSLLEWL